MTGKPVGGGAEESGLEPYHPTQDPELPPWHCAVWPCSLPLHISYFPGTPSIPRMDLHEVSPQKIPALALGGPRSG